MTTEISSKRDVSIRPTTSILAALSLVTETTGAMMDAVTIWSISNTVRLSSLIITIGYRVIGRANVPLKRFLTPAYQSGTLPRGGLVNSSLPSARTVRHVLELNFSIKNIQIRFLKHLFSCDL